MMASEIPISESGFFRFLTFVTVIIMNGEGSEFE